LCLIVVVRKEYVNAFRAALERREIDPTNLRMSIEEASTLETLRIALGSGNPRQIVYSLEMLTGVQDAEIVGAIGPLLNHQSPDVRRGAVRVLQLQEDGRFVNEMKKLTADPDEDIRRDAMDYVCHHQPGTRVETLHTFLSHNEPLVQAAAIACITVYGLDAEKQLITEDVVKALSEYQGANAEATRAQLAEALGSLGNPQFNSYLLALINDPSPRVSERAMETAGRSGERVFVSHLFDKLSDRRLRRSARRGLVLYEDRIVGAATDYIVDPGVALSIKAALCRTLRDIGTQHVVDSLVAIIDQVPADVRDYVLKALNSLRVRRADLRFSAQLLRTAVVREARLHFALLSAAAMLGSGEDEPSGLLRRALAEERAQGLERMFRLLQLQFRPRDIYGAYLAIVGTDTILAASAIEFLDNYLDRSVRKYILPAIDKITDTERIRRGQHLFEFDLSTAEYVISFLIDNCDAWLKACAINTVGKKSPRTLRDKVDAMRHDAIPLIRETAELAMSR
jgi:HEAT repeat protein